MVSLKTIAERCGVSTATVSKALNDHKDISEATRKRVRQVADELGYFPNAAARALKTNRSYNIGVLFEEEAGRGLTHEYFSGVLNGLKKQAEKLGYDITFINTCFENRKMSYYDHCRYRNFEGVAIVCACFFLAVDELGLELPENYIRTANYLEIQGAAEQTKELLNLPNPPSCIIYPDDTSLIGGRNVIIKRGMKIPQDISVAGYDGTMMSQLLYPKLTTISQNTELIGEEAAKRLIGTIEKPKTTLVERVVIEGCLIPGQSVGVIQPEE